MRTRLLPGLVDALARNAARQQARVRLFEIGKVFEDRESEERPAPLETLRVAAAASGDVADAQWGEPSRAVDFHDLKGDLESVAALSGASLDYRPSQAAWGHPGRSADVFRRRPGWLDRPAASAPAACAGPGPSGGRVRTRSRAAARTRRSACTAAVEVP